MLVTIIEINNSQNFNRKEWPNEGLLIFSDEWENRHHQCQNVIKSISHTNQIKLHGRNCKVSLVSKDVAKIFLEENHVQGCNNLSLVYFGLFYKDELVGIISLGRHSRQISENRIVLDRLCFKYDVHVNGGASKLFNRCIEWAKDQGYQEIISFSDNRWSDGNVYKVLGFNLEKEYKPDYCYVDTNNPITRFSKQSQKKTSSKCPEGMTEYEWAKHRGLERLWDRGKKRWCYSLIEGMTLKQLLSLKCATQHANGVFKHSHVRGYFKSKKNNNEIYFGSSYELRCLYLLDLDETIKSFGRAEVFVIEGRARNPDIQVEYLDGSIEIIEVKPLARLEHSEDQIRDTREYCKNKNFKLKIWTEKDSGLGDEKKIIEWAKKYIAETTGDVEWIEKQKENNRKRQKKYYDNVVSKDKISVDCEYCNETHLVLRNSYENNVNKNGKYICERYGGFLSGSKPKPHLKKENPYAVNGKKQCTKCKEIKLFSDFNLDKSKSRADGYSNKCKECNRQECNQRYHNKKQI